MLSLGLLPIFSTMFAHDCIFLLIFLSDMTDTERLRNKNELFDLMKEAHIGIWMYQNDIHPNWAVIAGDIKRAGTRLHQARAKEFMASPQAAKDRLKEAIHEIVKEPVQTPQEKLYAEAKAMGLKVRKTMKVETLERLIAEAK
jgi:hypothetical protein